MSKRLWLDPHILRPSSRHHFGAGLISRVVAVAHWQGHSSLEITYRVYAYLRPDDEGAGRAAMAASMRKIIPDVYRMCTQTSTEKENRR